MPRPVKSRRSYDSPRRRGQARATRGAVLEAARELFVERGFVATTIQAIADRAGVSPETVYATFGNKRSLLSSVIDVSITGDDAPVPLLDRAWVQEMRGARDPRRKLRILARNGRLILERISPVYEVLRGAAAADPEIAELRERYSSQRFAGQRELVRVLGAGGALRKGLSANSAAGTLFAIGSPETYRLLTIDRGWSPDRFERWYAETLARLLLA
ncbi:MAG: TetR/AcrR family transcriptional regulator [Actinomycetota bacterium]